MNILEIWEKGIAIGVLALVIPTLIWVVKTALNRIPTREVLQANHDELKGIVVRMNTAELDALKERDHVCTTDHNRLIEEMHRLNTHLSELTGMLTFILDHYTKTTVTKE